MRKNKTAKHLVGNVKKKREKDKCPTKSELIAGVGSDVVTSKGMAILYGVKTNPKLTKYH